MKRTIAVTALSGVAFFGLAACGGSGGSQPVSQGQEAGKPGTSKPGTSKPGTSKPGGIGHSGTSE